MATVASIGVALLAREGGTLLALVRCSDEEGSETLCAERGMPPIGYSYTLWERGPNHDGTPTAPGAGQEPRFIRPTTRVA